MIDKRIGRAMDVDATIRFVRGRDREAVPARALDVKRTGDFQRFLPFMVLYPISLESQIRTELISVFA